MVATLRIQLLGGFRLHCDETPVTTLDLPRLQTLLAYLVLHRDTPQSRQHLAFLLWPDSTETQARTNLRSLLHRLRQALPDADRLLHADAQAVQWRADAPWTLDIADFEHALLQAHQAAQAGDQPRLRSALTDAVERYDGDLLPGWYDDWVLLERERLRQLFLTALERLILLLEDQRMYAAAITSGQRLLRHDPLHEAAYQHLMRLHALSGDRASVIRVYQTCVTLLERELGVEPSPATQAAYERVLAMEPTPGQQLAPPTSTAPRHNLPVPPSLLIGRESELAELRQLLAAPECRLLTLLGPGGVGKTRLALQAGLEHTGAFRDGVAFVALAPVSAPEMIAPAIADALKFAFYGPSEPKEQLLNYLRAKQLLLILDNLEQLLAGAALLGDILMWAPQVTLLVTSRERLNLQQEWVYELQGLTCPTAEQTDALEGYSAVALFLRCARRARTAFALTEAEQPYISQICQLVEGMPLGLELAASWVRVLSCGEIAQEIRRSIDFLTTSLRDVPERHRSLRAVCDQSWNLLSNEERGALRKLAVFRGGCGREAAETVVGASLSLLAALVDKSLLRRTTAGRYEMHELIRQYAAAQLQADPPEESITRERFSQYYAAWLQRQKEQLLSSKQLETLAEMSTEIDNLRLAWDWMAAQRQMAQIRQSLHSLSLFHEIQNRFEEGETLFRQAVEALQTSGEAVTDTEHSVVLGQVLAQQARFCLRLGQIEQARTLLQQSLSLIRSDVGQAALADTLTCLGLADLLHGNFPGAHHYLEESGTLHRALGNQWEAAICLTLLGYTCQVQGAYEEAYRLLSESLTVLRAIGAPHGTAFCLQTLSALTTILGKYAEAQRLLDESLKLCRAINDRWGLATTLTSSGLMALAQGEAIRAEQLFRESLALLTEIGDRRATAIVLAHLGEALRVQGADAKARHCFLDSFRLAVEIQTISAALAALVGLAAVQSKEGTAGHALELLTHVLGHPASSQQTKARAERLRPELEAQLTLQQVGEAQERGRAWSFEAVVEEILHGREGPGSGLVRPKHP